MQKRGGKHIKYMSQMPSKDNSNKLAGRSNIELTIIDRNHSPHASMNRLVHGRTYVLGWPKIRVPKDGHHESGGWTNT